MSITSDIRAYADTAVSQGKQVLDTAQAQLNDVTGQANGLVGRYTAAARENVSDIAGKANGAVNELRSSAEKAVNINAIASAVEPYVAQFKEYTSVVTDKFEVLVSGVLNDKRVALVVDTVQQRVVKPVQELTGLGAKPVTKPTTKSAPKPSKAAAKPARKPAATRSSTSPANKPASKPAARKAPAKRTSQS